MTRQLGRSTYFYRIGNSPLPLTIPVNRQFARFASSALSETINRQFRAEGTSKIRRHTVDLLWTVAVILAVLWLLGMVTSYTLGGFLHILLVLAIVAVLIRVIQGRRVV